jgi:hypothetical protein
VDIHGYYEWLNLPKGQNYNVTASFPNGIFTFTPVAVPSLGANQVVNFVGNPMKVKFGGRVTEGSQGLAGVFVTATPFGTSQNAGGAASDSVGNYSFASIGAGIQYTITPSKPGYVFTPANQTLFISGSNSAQTFIAQANNPIDQTQSFVTAHYRDFLSREPDASGLSFWSGNVDGCTPQPCIEPQRVSVSAAFFLSIEYQQTGYLVEKAYKAAYGDVTATSTLNGTHQMAVPVVRFNELFDDTKAIGAGVVVLAPGWEQALENNKKAFMLNFVQRLRFTNAFPTSLRSAEFVDKLFANAGVVPTQADRDAAIAEFGSASTTADVSARARALRRVAENTIFTQQEFNRAFVLMEYCGYLRRNPDDAPEPTRDYTGYDFWLTKLNQFNGNYIASEMVKAFISSDEYRKRFGP